MMQPKKSESLDDLEEVVCKGQSAAFSGLTALGTSEPTAKIHLFGVSR